MRPKYWQKLIDSIPSETKARVDLEMKCLRDWETCHEDILEQAYDEGVNIDWSNPGQRHMLVNLCKSFYIKGIDDAYNKLKEYDKSSTRSTEEYL